MSFILIHLRYHFIISERTANGFGNRSVNRRLVSEQRCSDSALTSSVYVMYVYVYVCSSSMNSNETCVGCGVAAMVCKKECCAIRLIIIIGFS